VICGLLPLQLGVAFVNVNAPGSVPPQLIGAVAWSELESVLPVAFVARIKYVYVVPAVTFDPVFRKLRVPAGTPGEYKLLFR
jgi:hypothetical protein